MRMIIGSAVLVAAALTSVAPAPLAAQRRAAAPSAKHEFGVDIGVFYVKPENIDGGIVIGTPVDVRVGLVKAGKIMWEPRLTLNFSTVGGGTVYLFTPGVNIVYANSPGGNRNGMFLTGGVGLLLGDNGASNGTAFSLNGGVGWRKPYGNAAFRYELGFQYQAESTDLGLPSTLSIGARLGISLWH